jgi:hypothetical protein
MMIAFRSDWGRVALAARSLSSEGQESVAIPVRPICMKLRRSSGPEQRKEWRGRARPLEGDALALRERARGLRLDVRGGHALERVQRFLQSIWRKERPGGGDVHALMNLAMAASYDPDPKAPNGFRLPFNLETGELIPQRWARWPMRRRCSRHPRPAALREAIRPQAFRVQAGSRSSMAHATASVRASQHIAP